MKEVLFFSFSLFCILKSFLLNTCCVVLAVRDIVNHALGIRHQLLSEHQRTRLLTDLEFGAIQRFRASHSWARKFSRKSGWRLREGQRPVSCTSATVALPCIHCTCSERPDEIERNGAEYTLFRKKPYDSRIHIQEDDGSPTHCLTCALQSMREEKHVYVGFLNSTESRRYVATVKLYGRHSKEFRQEGATVIKGLQSKLAWPALSSLNNYVTTRGDPAELNDSSAKDDLGSHPGRLWENIYPGDSNDGSRKAFKSESDMHTVTKPLTTFIEEIFFPHEFFAQNAVITKNLILTSMDSKIPRERLLMVDHINLFLKRSDLDERQNLHVDGDHGIGVVAIYVEKCRDSKYSFYYVPKSHHRMTHHESVRKIGVPASAVKELLVDQGDLIIFPPSLIHAGGKASHGKCNYTKFINYIPNSREKQDYDSWNDISFQFGMCHSMFPSAIPLGKGRFFPYTNDEEKHVKAKLRHNGKIDIDVDDQAFQKFINEPGLSFKTALDESLSKWIQKLNGEVTYNTRNSRGKSFLKTANTS